MVISMMGACGQSLLLYMASKLFVHTSVSRRRHGLYTRAMFVIRREAHNPILSPQRERPWEAVATYNPSAIRTKDGVRIYYRALGNPDALQTPHAGLSSIGTAFSD